MIYFVHTCRSRKNSWLVCVAAEVKEKYFSFRMKNSECRIWCVGYYFAATLATGIDKIFTAIDETINLSVPRILLMIDDLPAFGFPITQTLITSSSFSSFSNFIKYVKRQQKTTKHFTRKQKK